MKKYLLFILFLLGLLQANAQEKKRYEYELWLIMRALYINHSVPMNFKTKLISTAVMAFVVATLTSSCQAQSNKKVGGPCEGCEAIYEYGDKKLSAIDTLPKFDQYKPQLKITGTVYKQDGRTPAENVIVYIYHTNRDGRYETKGDETSWARNHGFIRGWIKTGKDGKYTFYTFRPASYPDRSEPEHIHVTVKEPDRNEYYLDDYFFSDDPLVTNTVRSRLKNRGGSGIVKPKVENNMLTIKRDIILGKNIPDYE